ncbi:type II toxin-antitoxin system Phd/YefM family antitoxin [Mycobacterium intracellulare]|uniref:type II toxin-antitoxin system Phd/YefM family antitoxin n=1 Tax=Mycobacterium intracellulare TaxID=1767 RepID=UPI001CD91AF1|nr:type II toxin-antitoxin system prevent-host-death family antitoxin [Mycobacterium intracellulare]MCA2247554.1 type II toxin-antitoxin system Phd/YefM family antitoxin [Mycobacterium intracellulare]
MERIGIRELRQNASTWVARAQSGETIEIANHGRLVARLVPVGDHDTDREALIAAGRLTPAPQRGTLFDPADLLEATDNTTPSISEILQQQREDR